MKTNQILETQDRELLGIRVRQRTQDSYFCLMDIENVCIKARFEMQKPLFRLGDFMANGNVKEFLEALEKREGNKCYIAKTKSSKGWIHPYLAIKMLTYANPEFEISVYDWLLDLLIKYRIDSGDSYTKMCGVLYKHSTQKALFHKNIANVAKVIKNVIGVDNWNNATIQQLKDRDYLQNLIADLAEGFGDSSKGANFALSVYQRAKNG